MYAEFKAISVCKELNLNKIGEHFGIVRKFRWEDFLLLQTDNLKGIVNDANNKLVYVFHFGSMVLINFQHHEIMDVVQYMKKLEPQISDSDVFTYADDYRLEIDAGQLPAVNNDYMIADVKNDYQLEIVSTVLAKSVSLEKNEIEVDALLDRIENVVNDLNRGELGVSDEELAKMMAKIISFKLNTISYIMLLDNPDITWTNEEAATLYDRLSLLFELKDRYEKIRHKTETLMDITESFSDLVHARRGTRLEWAIIILIVIEIILSLYQMFFH
ncbi:MAG: putative YagE family [Firmicutes bacterium]|nr:putative YagE family [Bacillota bacterium]